MIEDVLNEEAAQAEKLEESQETEKPEETS